MFYYIMAVVQCIFAGMQIANAAWAETKGEALFSGAVSGLLIANTVMFFVIFYANERRRHG